MTLRITPDHGKYRWTRLSALVLLLLALAPGAGQAQRRPPRLLGTPVAQPADSAGGSATATTSLDGTLTPPPPTEPQSVATSSSSTETRIEFPVQRRLEMRSTAYCLRGTMRTGVRVRDGMAAGDPSVLPLGSVVRVTHPDGRLIGIFVIMDTGGAVRGNKIDLWFDSCREATDWGIRPVIAEVLDIGRA
ncbi:MAG TPA: 3D domain-containing protein [Longimicrobium sp.]|nr:3D domain-containing protein [Longimicrobium sp.]